MLRRPRQPAADSTLPIPARVRRDRVEPAASVWQRSARPDVSEQANKRLLYDILRRVRIVKHRPRETVKTSSVEVEEIRHVFAGVRTVDSSRPGGRMERFHELGNAHTYTTRAGGRL